MFEYKWVNTLQTDMKVWKTLITKSKLNVTHLSLYKIIFDALDGEV